MARRTQPAAVKAAKGNPGRRKIAAESPAATGAVRATFPAPRNLKADERAIWQKLAPELGQMRILRPTDLPAFRRYVVLLAKWAAVEKLLRPARLVQVTNSEHVQNMERISKALMVAIMLDKRLGEIEDRFGLNPSARQALLMKMAQVQPGLPFDPRPGDADRGSVAPVPVKQSPIGILSPAGSC